jgi:DNA-binding NarL/FixJ family response regulator
VLEKRVLLIDDEPDILMLLTELLSEDGRCLSVRTASQLDEAVALARAECPDVIVTDFTFGRRTSAEILPALREACPTAKVIVHTSSGFIAQQSGVVDLGADLVVQKASVSVFDVVEMVLG